MKILNLYAGIGGNRTLWGDEHEITAVEINSEIAGIYKSKFPNDNVIITDAHYYLLEHYKEFDFIWSSPPCPSHSKLCYSQNTKQYIDVALYQQIILLKSWFKGKYVIENVIPYYDYLVKPSFIIGRHPFWSNFNVTHLEVKNIDVTRSTNKELSEYLGIPIPRYKAGVTLRNSVEPKTGLHILNCAEGIIKENEIKQNNLF
jgi:DNA (cytosine-5)-methyltransferase 1